MNAVDRINDLIVIGGGLADLLTKENQALNERRTNDVAALLDDKVTLSRAFETLLEGFEENPGDLAKVDADLRERLRGLGERVQGLMEKNAHLLRVAIAAHEKVVESIAEAVKSTRPGPNTYSASGASVAPQGAAQQSTPISVDQAL